MSNITALATSPIAAPATSADAPPRGWLAGVIATAFSKISAKIGLIWILIVAFGAFFAPLLANSFPLLAKINGKWSSPALQYLTSADITLLIAALAAIALLVFARRVSLGQRAMILLSVIVVTFTFAQLFVHPRLVAGYEDYRVLQQKGKMPFAVWAPVRFSPTDHLRDRPITDDPFPWPPSRQHWLGTEEHGEDVFSVMIHACRIAMTIGFIATGLSLILAIVLGGFMGYFAGAADLIGMRLVEIFSSVPQLYLLMTFCAVFERNIYMVMAIIGVTSWPGDARFVRAEFLKLRGQDFVQSAVASGLPLRSVLFKHILPNALAPVLVSATFGVASAILTESFLSFLGIGLPVDAASWGRLLNQAVSNGGGFYWWIAIFPGLAIFFTVFAYNLIGESLRDALDPRLIQ